MKHDIKRLSPVNACVVADFVARVQFRTIAFGFLASDNERALRHLAMAIGLRGVA